MFIGVDARVLNDPFTGIGRYTFEVTKGISQFPDVRLALYGSKSIEMKILDGIGPCIFRGFSSSGRLMKMLFSQTFIPYWAARDCVDLYWGGAHRLPKFLPKSIAKVITIHDLVWKFAPQTMRPLSILAEKNLMPEAIKLADLVIVNSHNTASGMAEVFPQFAHKVRVIQLGTSLFPCAAEPGALSQLNITKPYFLFVGTLEPRKNLDRLLKAFSLVSETYRNRFVLVIVGGKGWGNINLQKLIQENQLDGLVKLLGYIPDHELALLYSNARFLIMPSIYEGFGLPILEAMQYGTPVLTSRNGSMAEVAGDGGMFIDPYSIESISAGIQRMLEDDELIKNLGRKALHRAKEFSWDKCAAETMAVFEEAIALRDIRMYRS